MELIRIRSRSRYSFKTIATGNQKLSISKSAQGMTISISVDVDNGKDGESYQVKLSQTEFLTIQSRYTDCLTRWYEGEKA